MREMSDNGKDEFAALNAIDLATTKEDKVCIERNHETGQLSWRFATPQSDPLGMMVRVLVHQVLIDSGALTRIEQLEKRVAELEAVR
jgi:hypothetical protein